MIEMMMMELVVEVKVLEFVLEVLPRFKFLHCPRTVGQQEVEDGGEDEVEEGDGGGSNQVQDGSKVR